MIIRALFLIAAIVLDNPAMAGGSTTIWQTVLCWPSGTPGQLMCRLEYPEGSAYYSSREKCRESLKGFHGTSPSIQCMSRRVDTWSAD